ncbi:MAG: hypothetical protein ACTSW1_10585 [Candidatus Hodarchaeales archaeon]
MKKSHFSHFSYIFLILLILGFILTYFPSVSSSNTSITYQLETLWDGTDVKAFTISGEYLYLQVNESNVILINNGSKIAEYKFNQTIYSITAANSTLFIPGYFGNATVSAVSFNNLTHPLLVSTIGHWTTGGSPSIISYNNYVYAACQEWGFPIFDFSVLTHPKQAGYVPLSTWHSRYIYRIYHYGIFYGDYRSGIFDLSDSPKSPRLLWEFRGNPGINSGYIIGIPSISSQYFVLNFDYYVVGEGGQKMFYIIPRENSTHIGQSFNLTYSPESNYKHTALLHDNILLVSDNDNTLSLFEIKNKELDFLLNIYLGQNGSIKQLYPLWDSNELLIANGDKGLLKLSLSVTRYPSTTSNVSGFSFSILILLPIVLRKFTCLNPFNKDD